MRFSSRSAWIALLVAAIAAAGIATSAVPAAAADPEPTLDETARLLGYMWGDGTETNGVWEVNGPSGAGNLIEELVETHGGTWVSRKNLRFRLPAPYNWADWKDGLPNNSTRVRNAVQNPHFLAAMMETEASVFGLIYDQSACCTDGLLRGRLPALRDLLLDKGYASARFVPFNNVNSGKVTISAVDYADLRADHQFVCTNSDSDIRIPGGSNYAQHGNLRWIVAGHPWDDVVRTDCRQGRAVPNPTPVVGSCSLSASGNNVTIDWTFTLGEVNVRRDGSFVTNVSGRDGSWSQTRSDGSYSYALRVFAFGERTDVNCGTVNVPGNGTPTPPPPPPPADGPCVVTAAGNSVQLSWDDEGQSRYFVRKNGKWVQTVSGGGTTATAAGSIQDTWTIRYFGGGNRVDLACSVAGTPTGPCQVTAAGGGANITWNAVDGVSKYQVRRNGSWRAAVSNATTYIDATGSTADSYVVRYFQNGARTDLACG